MTIEEKLIDIFNTRSAGPFLFVGSGFSRRYLGLENWKGLLARFCVAGQPFEYYLSKANGDLAIVSELLASDFNEYWWTTEEYKTSVERYKAKITDSTTALRIEIANYLSTLDQSKAKGSEYPEEVELLATLNVDGIITTNWDLFIEQLFPDYKVYVGQEQLLFSNPQEIGEIYKIHGCSSNPSSMVLTKKDYDEFNEKNAYLAAKLITLFVEHPIVFIGYSISDENIGSLLKAISKCIGKQNIEQLRKNLIFIQKLTEGEKEGISDTYLTIDGIQIPLVLIKTNDYCQIYKAIDSTKRKIPARVLRLCKEQLYELVQSSQPEKKLGVINLDEIETKEDIEFVVGVGIAAKAEYLQIAEVGYAKIDTKDLIQDLLHNNKKYDSKQILEKVVRDNCRFTPNVPVFKYLKDVGIHSLEDYKKSGLTIDKCVLRELKDFRGHTYSKPFFRKYRHMTLQEIIQACTPENSAAYIPYLTKEKIDVDLLRDFLIANENKMEYTYSNYASSYRKLAVLYDRLKYGW